MALGENGFRARAVSILHPFSSSKPFEIQEKPKTEVATFDEKQTEQSGGQAHHTSGTNAEAHDRVAQRIVRTIPAWVHAYEDDLEDVGASSHLLPSDLPPAQIAQHNSNPTPKQKAKPAPGRLYDSLREWTPPTSSIPDNVVASRWRAFADSSAYTTETTGEGMIVDEEWLVQNGADYSQPWLASTGDEDANMNKTQMWQSKRRTWWVRAQRTVLRNPMIPLVFRSVVFIFSTVALAIAGSIYHRTRISPDLKNTASTDMAITVDAIALVYILYITYDEYTGKPLGLRSARAKLRLIFLDLIFIVFNSANLSLAFDGIHDRNGVCGAVDEAQDNICHRQTGLACVLLVALIAWLMNFSTSVLRIVERVTQR